MNALSTINGFLWAQPAWLWMLAAALAPPMLAAWGRRRGRHVPALAVAAQALSLALAAIALAEPRAALTARADRPAMLAVDVSASVRGQTGTPTAIHGGWGPLPPALAPPGVRLERLYFAGDLSTSPACRPDATRAGPLLRLLADHADDLAGAILVTDGQFTDPDWLAAAQALGRRGLDLLIVPLADPPPDASVRALTARRAGDRVELRVALAANKPTQRELVVRRAGRAEPLTRRRVELLPDCELPPDAAGLYVAQLEPADALPENDSASAIVLPSRGKLLAAGLPPEARALLAGAADVEHVALSALPESPEPLWAYPAVIVADDGGGLLPRTGSALARYVRAGGGLVMLGVGPHARPADRDDPLNLVLPLVPTPYERRPLHLLVLLDRSGSMAQLSPATPDSPAQVKFDVAAQAVVALQEHLTPRDRLTVITFADRPEKLFDAGPGTTDFAQLREALRRVRPSGSTRLGPALDLALGQDRTGQQPMLLVLSDAQTEDFQPAAYADRFRQGPVELAAVVIGDADGNQPPPPLETLAKLLSATYVRQEGMAGLARVFGRLVRQGRGDILRPGPFELQPAGPLFDLPPRPLPAAQAIYQAQALGQAQVLVRTAGGEPVVARERIALGRSVSLALPAGGPNQAWAAAPASAKLVAAALRWARREPNDPRLAVELARPDGRLAVRVRAEDQGKPVDGLHLRARIDRPEAPRPGGATQPADAGAAFELPQVAPGRYEAATPWPADEPAPVVVELDDRQAWSGASPALYAPEFARIGPDYDALRRLAEATGGRIVAADEAARALRQSRARAMTPLWPLAAGLALALMLTEWCLTRVRRA